MIKKIPDIPDIFDILVVKLFFGIVIGIPIIGLGMFFGTFMVFASIDLGTLIFNESSLTYDFEHTLKTIKYIVFPLVISGLFGIVSIFGGCGLAIRIPTTYKKLLNNHIQIIRVMLFCGQYACLGAVGVMLLFVEFEEFRKIVAIVVLFSFSFLVFSFCICATPKRL